MQRPELLYSPLFIFRLGLPEPVLLYSVERVFELIGVQFDRGVTALSNEDSDILRSDHWIPTTVMNDTG